MARRDARGKLTPINYTACKQWRSQDLDVGEKKTVEVEHGEEYPLLIKLLYFCVKMKCFGGILTLFE